MAEETELPMEGVARLAVTFTAVVAPRKEEDARETQPARRCVAIAPLGPTR